MHAGTQAVKTWTFTPRCATGSCTTSLARPSILPGSTRVKTYTLKPLSASEYKGAATPTVESCVVRNSKQSVANAYTLSEVLDLHVTRVAKGLVAAYSGTDFLTYSPTAVGRGHGCTPAVQDSTFTG